MSVSRHGSKWRADWRDEFGLRHRRDFKLKVDAEVFERERRSAAEEARKARCGDAPACDPNLTFEGYASVGLPAGGRTTSMRRRCGDRRRTCGCISCPPSTSGRSGISLVAA